MTVICEACGLRYWVGVKGDPHTYVDPYHGMRYCPHCGELIL